MYHLDCIPSSDDPKSRRAQECLAMITPLPESFTLIPNLPPVRDQGMKGCCVAHAVSCMKEEQERRDVRFKKYFSVEFIYNLRPNRPQAGMYIHDALELIKVYGILPEKNYPYDYDAGPDDLPPRLKSKALNYRIRGYARIYTMDELKHALLEAGPCPAAFPVYQLTGKIWQRSSTHDKLMGYHAMTVVGWTSEGFILRNSWGPNWGCGGYTTYPYEDWDVHCEIWTSYDDQSESDLSDSSGTLIGRWRRFLSRIFHR
jgi:hypothetical protein